MKSQWNAVPTIESLTELGNKIIQSVPEEKRGQFGDPLVEGFNSLNFKQEDIYEVLHKPYFSNKYVSAVGKTEWWEIQWNDHTIADKKTIINRANFVFVSAESIDHCKRAKTALQDAGVNHRLLDCSDAHDFSDSADKDRLGKCFTWIKADTEFEGLVQAFHEPEGRIFLGDIPPKKKLVSLK